VLHDEYAARAQQAGCATDDGARHRQPVLSPTEQGPIGVVTRGFDILNRSDLPPVAVSLVENVLRMRREREGG